MRSTTDATERLWQRATRVLAAGRWSPSNGVAAIPAGARPLVARRASGCRSIDADGRECVEYRMGWGSARLGFAHPRVREAIVCSSEARLHAR